MSGTVNFLVGCTPDAQSSRAPLGTAKAVKPSCLRIKNARQASEVAHFSPVVPRSHLRHVDIRLKEVNFKSFIKFFCRIDSVEVNLADKKMSRLQCCRSRSSGPFRPLDPGFGSGMGKKTGSGMTIPDHFSESLETVFGIKNLNSCF
jgi:hypothetical protein